MKNIKEIAIIGCGYWGSIIAKNLRELTKKRIYLYDINKKNSKNLHKKIKNSVIINSIKDIYINSFIKNVFLITPPSSNFKIVKNLINSKKNIFIEKPGFTNLNDYEIINRLNNKHNNVIMIGYVYLFNKNIIKIKNILKKHELGRILFIKSSRENLGPIRTNVDCNYDLASHDLSILFYLIGNKIILNKSIKYKILNNKIADISTLSLNYKNIKINIESSWLNPEKIRKLVIIGSKKMLVFNEMSSDNNILIYNQYAKYPKVNKLNKLIFSNLPKIYRGSFRKINIKNNNPLRDELKHFFYCVENKRQPKTNLQFAKKIITLLGETNKN